MRDNPTTSIVGGTPAQTGDFPYMVPLFMHFQFIPRRCNDKIWLNYYYNHLGKSVFPTERSG